MEKFRLGAVPVGRVGFGAMRLAGPGIFGPPADSTEAVAVLRAAVESGVDHIDTAQYYGPDVVNDLIREALHPYPEDLAIVSKVGYRRDERGGIMPWDDPPELRRGIEENLRSLRVDRLAAVNLRLPGPYVSPGRYEAQLVAMAQARDDGLIAGVGVSNVTHEQLLRALEVTDVVCVQNAFNLTDRSSLPVLRECTARGIAFVPFGSLGSYGQPNPEHDERVRAVAQRHGATPAQAALLWALAAAPNVLVIPGTSSRVHLAENLKVRDMRVGSELAQELDDALSA